MKGNQQLIDRMNMLLADELAAINQYFVHAEMSEDWGYEKLHERLEKRAIEEMHHAEKLIARILFLEGMPVVSQLGNIHIGHSVEKQLETDHGAELEAIQNYNEAIRLAVEVKDNGTRDLLEEILREEEDHIDWIEAQMDLIEQIGYQTYLVEQID